MKIEEVEARLDSHGFEVKSKERLPNDKGTKITFTNGAVVSIYDTGTISVQGKNKDAVNDCLGIQNTDAIVKLPIAKGVGKQTLSKVFVVYGHDRHARTSLEAMLRRWKLDPLILDQLPNEGQTIIEKLKKAMDQADFAIVLATPDDKGYRADHADEIMSRARQNVVLELGMLLTLLGREKVAILIKNQDTMEKPSDIHGLIYIPFRDDLQSEAGQLLAKEMNVRGYEISIGDL